MRKAVRILELPVTVRVYQCYKQFTVPLFFCSAIHIFKQFLFFEKEDEKHSEQILNDSFFVCKKKTNTYV